jgi:hypothetical protein
MRWPALTMIVLGILITVAAVNVAILRWLRAATDDDCDCDACESMTNKGRWP